MHRVKSRADHITGGSHGKRNHRQGAGGCLFHSALYPPRDTKKRALPHPAGAASGRRVAGSEAQAPAHQRVYGGTAAAGGIPGNGRSPGEAAAHDTALGCRYRQTGQQSAGRGTLSPAQGTAGHATHIGRGQAHARRGCVSCGARHHAGHDGRAAHRPLGAVQIALGRRRSGRGNHPHA